jgi:uncharacterized membrane protein
MKKAVVYLIAFSFVFIGVTHFISPSFFINIMPPSLPCHIELVYLSGFFEISLGALLVFNKTRKLAGWGLILLLIAVFPANIYLAQSTEAQQALGISETMAIVRLPFQLVFIGIAFWLTRD